MGRRALLTMSGKKLSSVGPGKSTTTNRPDPVSNPPHYQRGGIEAIDVIEAFDLNYRLGNVIKYVLRHELKGGVESLRKAAWYLNREIENAEAA